MLELLAKEPTVKVGLITGAERVSFTLNAEYLAPDDRAWLAGNYVASVRDDGNVVVKDAAGRIILAKRECQFRSVQQTDATFTLRGITIGIDFHWQRQEDQQFNGALILRVDEQRRLLVINEIGVEAYLISVIASEMSATAHPELLKAHAIISRSWLLAQLAPWKVPRAQTATSQTQKPHELIRWYDREDHTQFDICADDHCQRYQGRAKATAAAVFEAINDTRGQVLSHAGALCDTRFSKSCGGFTELYRTAWEDIDVPYLQAFYDGEHFPAQFALSLIDEANAAQWIRSAPPAFCHTQQRDILTRILPSFDQETVDFYRWQVRLQQDELQALLQQKLALDFGAIKALAPVERGASGRLVRLRIVGERQTLVIGKELEIRRALSNSHLYSSALVIEPGAVQNGVPAHFTLYGAGWGHGVGLCQIGAALMAEEGYVCAQILRHYYRGAQLFALYRGSL
jgi:stage II sporulation protein D